jgi:hypothetical protein
MFGEEGWEMGGVRCEFGSNVGGAFRLHISTWDTPSFKRSARGRELVSARSTGMTRGHFRQVMTS